MAQITTCDRCGKVIDAPRFIPMLYTGSGRVSYIGNIEILRDSETNSDDSADLCQECQNEFFKIVAEFMKGRK